MGKYILKRLALLIPVMLGVVVLVFTILHAAPGDPATVRLGAGAPSDQVEALRERLGLNRPFVIQLISYMRQVFVEFDFGESLISGISITKELVTRFPRTLLLALTGIVIGLGVGVPLGVNAAVHQNRPADYLSMAMALLGTSMPGFWLALMLVLGFSFNLGWLPAYGMEGPRYWILPIIANAFNCIAVTARQTRSGMLDVLNSDYIVMAKAKGMRQRDIIYKEALPNAIIPVITLAGGSFGSMLGGALIIEMVFSLPGVGSYLVTGVNNRDYYVVLGGVIVLSVAFSAIMLLCDLLIAAINPQIKAQFAGSVFKRRVKDG